MYQVAGFVLAVWILSMVAPERIVFLLLLTVLLGQIVIRWQEIDSLLKEVFGK